MRITNNMVTSGILNELNQLESQQSSLQTEVSTGLSLTQPSDNPTVFGQVIQLEGQNSQNNQYSANATQALNVANASYSGINSLQQIYDRASQLGTLGTGTLGSSAAASYASELDQLIQQSVQTVNGQLDGAYLYAGTATDTPPYTTTTDSNGQITAVSYVGNSMQTTIPVSTTANVAPGTSGTTNAGFADLINNMISLRDALTSGDSTAMNTANTALSGSDAVITDAVADNGAVQARIQAEQTQLQSASTQTDSLISGDTNADLPSTIVKLNQAQVAYQAALQTSASVMQMSLLNYIHLQ